MLQSFWENLRRKKTVNISDWNNIISEAINWVKIGHFKIVLILNYQKVFFVSYKALWSSEGANINCSQVEEDKKIYTEGREG